MPTFGEVVDQIGVHSLSTLHAEEREVEDEEEVEEVERPPSRPGTKFIVREMSGGKCIGLVSPRVFYKDEALKVAAEFDSGRSESESFAQLHKVHC